MRPENKLEILDTIEHSIEALKDLNQALTAEDATAISEHYADLEAACDLFPFLLSDYLTAKDNEYYPTRPENEQEIQDTIEHSIEALKTLREAVEDEAATAMNKHYKDLRLAYGSLQVLLSPYL